MRILGKINSIIQSHIVMAFSALIVASFMLILFVFNFSMNLYVKNSAIYALNSARAAHENIEDPGQGFIVRKVARGHRFVAYRYIKVDENYEPLDLLPEYMVLPTDFSDFAEPGLLPSDEHRIYVVAVPTDVGAVIYYLNVSNLLSFISVMNRILVVSVIFIWLSSTLIATFLADSFMRPLRLLRDFVRQIGHGDFTPNTHRFVNEEFNELNQSLNSTALRLDAYDNEQKAFFQNVSHELRTPLTVIKMYGEGIQSGVMDGKTAATTILEAETRLAGMVDDVLYISRLDSVSPPPMEEINIRITIEECIRLQRPVAESQGIEMRYTLGGEPILLVCAMNYIERALNNLISNAIRYAKKSVSVECYAYGSIVTIRVCDDGPGFEPHTLPHVFERFYRGKGGITGIGLSIVKSIVDMHKGIATAENGEKSGAVLTISFPRKKG
ncbi:MAG: HAMP domain-containing histidine kinase [Defluviitaleaceae bacterium]|nr:HAMP domain-containing histidine kinase [Defluviitaleaceae bacterium]